MKPDKKTCRFCGKEIEGKKLYCDDAHRMAWKRQTEQSPAQVEQIDNPNTNKPEQKLPEQETEQDDDLRSTLTKCDKTFTIGRCGSLANLITISTVRLEKRPAASVGRSTKRTWR